MNNDSKFELLLAEVGDQIHKIEIEDDKVCCEICSLIMWDPVSCKKCD